MLLLVLGFQFVFSLSLQQNTTFQQAVDHPLYTGELISIEVGGIARQIAILGESHKKTKAASELGEKVIKTFPYRGIEMPPIDDLNHSYLQAVLMGFAVGVDRTFGYIRNKLGFKKGATSILDAMYRGFFITQENQVAYNGYLLGELHSDGFYYSHERVSKLVPQLPQDKVKAFFELLDSHVKRNLQVRKKVDLGFLEVKVINPFPTRDKMVRSEFLEEITIGIEFGQLSRFSSRDERMAKNILAFLENYPEATSMLIIVGALHVSPVKALLMQAN